MKPSQTVRLLCSNCGFVIHCSLKNGIMDQRCQECNLLVGWLPFKTWKQTENKHQHPCRKSYIP